MNKEQILSFIKEIKDPITKSEPLPIEENDYYNVP